MSQCSDTMVTGEGTYYGYSGGGNCSLPHPYSKLYSAALNASQYAGAVMCGACVEATGERGSIVVSIEDQCPECKFGDLDFTLEAFPLIADPIKGRVSIKWKLVPCPHEGPLVFLFNESSTAYWAAVQIRNHLNPIKKLEVLTADGYNDVPKADYNYFIAASGLGNAPFTFKITDYYNNEIVEKDVPFQLNTSIVVEGQFPHCDRPLNVNSTSLFGDDVLLHLQSGELTIKNKSIKAITFHIKDLMGRTLNTDIVSGNSIRQLQLHSNQLHLVFISSNGLETVKKISGF